MSPRKFLLLVLGLTFLATACVLSRHSLGDLPPVQFRIGSGAGDAGPFKEYILLENGQVFLFESTGGKLDTFELETISWKEKQIWFEELEELRLLRYNFNYPGEKYFFIRQIDELVDHKVQWGNPDWVVRSDVEQFYRDLTEDLENRQVIFTFGQKKEGKEEKKEPTFW